MFSNRHAVVLGLLLTCCSPSFAELRFGQASVNLGEVCGGPAHQHRFEFVNDSSAPLEIMDIRLGCGCLQPVLEKRLYQGGEKGSLLMNIRTLGQANGLRSWQAHVQYRQGNQLHETLLILAATIRNEVTVEPSILAMSVETTLRQEITITDHRSTTFKVLAVVGSSPALTIRSQSQDRGITRVSLEVHGSALSAATQQETITIYTDDPSYRELQVPITLTKARRLEVSATPGGVELSGTLSGSKLVRVRASGDRKVSIEKVESGHPAVSCTWAEGPGNDATLKISVDFQQLVSASEMRSVRVYLSQPSATTLTIPVVMRKE